MDNYSRIIVMLYKIKENEKINAFIYNPKVYQCLKKSKDVYEKLFLKKYNSDTEYKVNKIFFEENRGRILANIGCLADEHSKKIYKQMIEFRCKKSSDIPNPYSCNDLYFPKNLVKITKKEVFVDCGAFIGDTIAELVKRTENKYKRVVAFEPDAENLKMLLKRTNKDNRITVVPAGLWNENCELSFLAGHSDGSFIVENRNKEWTPKEKVVKIPVVSIDEIAECNDATFIKMDIEGAELMALKGATQTIQKNSPILAISIYHSNEDMINIIEYLSNNYRFYNYFVRQHSPSTINETVLYCIPISSAEEGEV